jgi:hypothetical protein
LQNALVGNAFAAKFFDEPATHALVAVGVLHAFFVQNNQVKSIFAPAGVKNCHTVAIRL